MGYGPFMKLAIEPVHTLPGALTTRVDFLPNSTLGLREEFIDGNGLRGTLSRDISRIIIDKRRVNGNLRFEPNMSEIRTLLPWMFGTAESGAGPYAYALGDSPIVKWVTVDRVQDRDEYTSCAVRKWRIHGAKGQPLVFELDLFGMDENKSATAFNAALTIDTATPPFAFSQLILTIASVQYYLEEFDLNCDLASDVERFFNSPTLTGNFNTDRNFTLPLKIPYVAATALYGLVGTSGTAGIAATSPSLVATFTNGVNILTITLANVAWPRESPQAQDRGELMLPVNLKAYANGATKEVSATLAIS